MKVGQPVKVIQGYSFAINTCDVNLKYYRDLAAKFQINYFMPSVPFSFIVFTESRAVELPVIMGSYKYSQKVLDVYNYILETWSFGPLHIINDLGQFDEYADFILSPGNYIWLK